MTTYLRSATVPAFEETRPAPYLLPEGLGRGAMASRRARATPSSRAAAVEPVQPLPPLPPQGAWLVELELDPPPGSPGSRFGWRSGEGRAPSWLRFAGLAVAVLLALLAIGLAVSLLDLQRPPLAATDRPVAATRG